MKAFLRDVFDRDEWVEFAQFLIQIGIVLFMAFAIALAFALWGTRCGK